MLIPLNHKMSKSAFAGSLSTALVLQGSAAVCRCSAKRASNKFDKLQKRFDVISGRCH